VPASARRGSPCLGGQYAVMDVGKKPPTSVERLLYRYPEAAIAMNMSEDAVQKLVAEGEIKVIRPGVFAKGSKHASRVVLIPVSEIHAWIERQLAAEA
jgi:hypothetical protein